MAGVNKVIIVGNLGKDPETRFLPNGDAVANMTIATSDEWKDKQTGEAKSKVEWHRVVMFGKLAEIAGQYLTKGSKVYVEGKLQTRKWTNQQGQDQYTTEIVLQGFNGVMQMLDSKNTTALGQQQSTQNNQQQAAPQQHIQQGQSNSQGFKSNGNGFGQQPSEQLAQKRQQQAPASNYNSQQPQQQASDFNQDDQTIPF